MNKYLLALMGIVAIGCGRAVTEIANTTRKWEAKSRALNEKKDAAIRKLWFALGGNLVKLHVAPEEFIPVELVEEAKRVLEPYVREAPRVTPEGYIRIHKPNGEATKWVVSVEGYEKLIERVPSSVFSY